VKPLNVEIKWIFPKIKTSFQGEISKCKNKMDFSKNEKIIIQGEISKCRDKMDFSKNKNKFPR
jgi:hypothetical protein